MPLVRSVLLAAMLGVAAAAAAAEGDPVAVGGAGAPAAVVGTAGAADPATGAGTGTIVEGAPRDQQAQRAADAPQGAPATGDGDGDADADAPAQGSGQLAIETPATWATADPAVDGWQGTASARAHAELALRQPDAPVVVAVIDTGIDIDHPDLRGRIWENAAERDGRPGIDDDGNGYVDDVHGWNFIGSRDGSRQLLRANLEVTREYRRLLRLRAAGGPPEAERAYFTRIEQRFLAGKHQALSGMLRAARMLMELERGLAVLHRAGLGEETLAAVEALPGDERELAEARALVAGMLRKGLDAEGLRDGFDEAGRVFRHHYDLSFDESSVIGDDPERLDEAGYGNPRVDPGENCEHGTHVAGIIAALRGNGIGIDGQAEHVRIMALVAVPDGDERDKDVANAVRYAVDNGARIINMSFGKPFSPQRAYVEAAFRHAEERGVLVVHAAGNAGRDIDQEGGFPSRRLRLEGGGERAYANWLVVGASAGRVGPRLAAGWSNYGAMEVDLFAPGDEVLSLLPDGGEARFSGTSMAAPQVAGVAALVWAQHPRLSAVDLRQVLRQSARIQPGLRVERPGSRGRDLVPFASLSASGGIVDAHRALRLLAEAGAGAAAPPGAPGEAGAPGAVGGAVPAPALNP